MFGKKKNPATYDEKYLLQELMMTKRLCTLPILILIMLLILT